MGFFKKNNGTGPDSTASDRANDEAGSAPNKKKSELAKVLDESVWESANEDFKANKQFILTDDDGGVKYVALLFETESIGGLAGKAARKDESKGSIIEAVKTGRIKTYIRTEMLYEDCFIIIPDKDTVENMDEFRMLIDATYKLCTVTPDGVVETVTVDGKPDSDEHVVTYKQVRSLIESGGDVKELFPSDKIASDVFSGSDVNYDDDDEDVETLPDDEDDIEDLPDAESLSEDPADFADINSHISDSAPVAEPVKPAPAAAPADEEQFDFGDDTPSQNAQSDVSDEEYSDDYYEDNYEDVLTQESVRDFAVRKFYSDDLGLEVSSQPFDAQFMHGNAWLPFNENRGAGWLNENLSNLAKDGNVRMERLHAENLYRLREKYMRIIQSHCESIAKTLDVSDESTQFGQLRYAIEANKDENINSISESIEPKRRQLDENWERTLERVGEAAKAAAIQQHEDRYGKQHKADIMNLEAHEKDEIERDYNNAIKRMNDDRKAEATKLLDIAINSTLKKLSDIYLRVLQQERKEYIRIQDQMTTFIDENRKNEVARIKALEEENKQYNKAEEVRKEYASKIKALSAEFEGNTTKLQAEVNKMRIDHENEIRLRTSEYDKAIKAEKEKTADVQRQLDELLNKYAELENEKKAEYSDRIAQLQRQNESIRSDLDHVTESHKRSNKIAVWATVVAIIAAIGAGFMLGSIINVRRASNAEKAAIERVQQDAASQTEDDSSSTNSDNESNTDSKDESSKEDSAVDTSSSND